MVGKTKVICTNKHVHKHTNTQQDFFEAAIRKSSDVVVWNFGDADEEAQAFSTGNSSKVAKVAKKVQAQRLSMTDTAWKGKDASIVTITLPFIGHVSSVKSNPAAYEICKLFGCTFYMNPMPAPTPASPVVVPAWLASTTNKAGVATMMERFETIACATRPET